MNWLEKYQLNSKVKLHICRKLGSSSITRSKPSLMFYCREVSQLGYSPGDNNVSIGLNHHWRCLLLLPKTTTIREGRSAFLFLDEEAEFAGDPFPATAEARMRRNLCFHSQVYNSSRGRIWIISSTVPDLPSTTAETRNCSSEQLRAFREIEMCAKPKQEVG